MGKKDKAGQQDADSREQKKKNPDRKDSGRKDSGRKNADHRSGDRKQGRDHFGSSMKDKSGWNGHGGHGHGSQQGRGNRNHADQRQQDEQSLRQRHGIEKIEWTKEEKEQTQSSSVARHGSAYKSSSNRHGSRSQGRNGGRNRRTYGGYLGYEEDERGSVTVSGRAFSQTSESIHEEVEGNAEPAAERNSLSAQGAEDVQNRSMENEDLSSSSRIEGRNAVTEAFRSGRTIDRLYILEGCEDGPIMTIKRMAAEAGTPIRYVTRQRLDQMSETGSHQGVIANVAVYHYATIDDLFRRAEKKGEDPFFIILDNIEDPHNLGAIIRTANVVGAHGVIIAKDRAVGLTATVAKASAGAINFTPVVKVTNISQTIQELKKRGLWFVCADMDGQPMTKLNLSGPIGMVIGAEGAGVSRLVRENCDIVASIPQRGEIDSLNASVACGVLAYEILRQRTK